MKAKLRKDKDHYRLFVEDKQIGSTGTRVSSKEMYQLSFENCDEIFGVVDVEKLILEADTSHLSLYTSDANQFMFDEGLKIGFNKAMELNKDKVFTLEDMNNAMDWIMNKYFEFHEQPTTSAREQYYNETFKSE